MPHQVSRSFQPGLRVALVAVAALFATACEQVEPITQGETLVRGYVPVGDLTEKVKPGNTQEQVIIQLGTPSTIATINGDVFYYISSKQYRRFMFQQPKIVDQNVTAIYFDKNRKVEKVANYGLQDGKLFDFVSRTTPSGGEEANFIRQLMRGPLT